jgi:acyl-CoA hydrolase
MTNSNQFNSNKLMATHSFTVFPQDLNYVGSLFGGKVMAEIIFGE